MQKSQGKNINYPENQRYRRLLKRGDVARLAELSGYSRGSVYMILAGQRRMTLNFQKAFLEFMKEKDVVTRAMEEISNNE